MASSVLGATAALAGGYEGSYDGGGYRDHRRAAREPDYGAYVGLSIGELRYHEDGLGSITPAAALLRIGAPLGSNLAIEARAGAANFKALLVQGI